MDLILATIIALGLRHNTPAPVPPPAVMQPGTVRTIPDPLPYVLDEQDWGPSK